ncbi:MAG TPA: hypothetical protein VK929_16890, partial [Longimicrobiales bacterium]|nr:hypothetical protein [Longimicrobiales bacterium]
KSTLVEAMLWALFGPGAIRGGEDSLRPIGAKVDAVTGAALDFTIGGAHYRVTRTLHGTAPAVTLHRDGSLIAEDAAVDDALAPLTGRRDSFLHGSVTGSRELRHLVELRPPERLRALARLLGTPTPPPPSPLETLQQEIAESDERIRTLQSAPDLLAQYAPELKRARSDLESAEREAERLHDEWAQKRQDVETRLAAYRRRVDEIRGQIERLAGGARGSGVCPTCEHPLGGSVEQLIARLDDEVYSAAQDIKWLAQRQAQLAQKPPDVGAADTRRTRLRELVADRTERVARCEQAMQELWTVATDRRRALLYVDALRSAADSARGVLAAPPDTALLRTLETHAGDIVARVTASRCTGLVIQEDGRVFARSGDTVLPAPGGADEELFALALRLAVMRVLDDGKHNRLLIVDEPFAGLSAARRDALLHVLRDEAAQVIVCTTADVGAAAQRIVLEFDRTTGCTAVQD